MSQCMFLNVRRDHRFSANIDQDIHDQLSRENEYHFINHNTISYFEDICQNILHSNDVNCQIENMYCLQSFTQKYYKSLSPNLTEDFLTSIAYLINSDIKLSCIIYDYFSSIIQLNPAEFFEKFQNINFLMWTIEKINNDLNSQLYHRILIFLCTIISNYSQSISYFSKLDLIKNLLLMNQDEYIEQHLMIYASVLEVECIDTRLYLNILPTILDFLKISRITIVANALLCLQNVLQANRIEGDSKFDVWKTIIFDKRLSFLLQTFNNYIISYTIFCYSLICSYGDEPIMMLLEEKEIYSQIFSNLFIHNLSNEVHGSILDLLISMLTFGSSSCFDSIFNLIIELNIPKQFEGWSFNNKEKVIGVVIKLYNNSNRQQIREIMKWNMNDTFFQIIINDEDMTNYFFESLQNILNRFPDENEITEKIFHFLEENQDN
ncbi:hypothetical protein TRFO_03727 [Tritrichomonas foetus]|uniref:Uncharacterized protein n=1 Tax=Tritrichomonas foetus TaxID=1144522 RepID=A0A1J4KMF0_9EUKA|nr:hypothetical protein TRFO_03727 [Tritrichomonas foetus]|eukprot:OHT12104.1 hypothetical protein TRFO_03727 [Tritrichomonas foetus]